jgi:predicted nuclease of restriction endonuclease-like (RecB) superfamily
MVFKRFYIHLLLGIAEKDYSDVAFYQIRIFTEVLFCIKNSNCQKLQTVQIHQRLTPKLFPKNPTILPNLSLEIGLKIPQLSFKNPTKC